MDRFVHEGIRKEAEWTAISFCPKQQELKALGCKS
jgi:hypothetical protein